MLIPKWLVGAAAVTLLLSAGWSLALVTDRNPLPFPDRNYAVFTTPSPEAKGAVLELLGRHGQTPRFRMDTDGVERAILWDGTIINYTEPGLFESLGAPGAAIGVVASDPARAALEAVELLRQRGFRASMIEGAEPGLPIVFVTTDALNGAALVFRKHALRMGGRPTPWKASANDGVAAPRSGLPGDGALYAARRAPDGVLAGDTVVLGNGVIRSWVETDPTGRPTALGVTLPEATLEALPAEGVMLSLDFPRVDGLPFPHVLFDWVPHGHPPAGLYGHPHWDAHFYLISAEERRAIPAGETDLQPDPRYMPEGYLPVPGLGLFNFPEMGVHWMDEQAGELHGHTFDQTLIYGSTGTSTIFVEPMFTNAFLETRPDLSSPVPQPEAVAVSGYYPTRYVIRHDPEARSFRVSLEGMRWRDGG